MQILESKISLRRWIAFAAGGTAALAFFLHLSNSYWFPAIAGGGVALGVTDFGRRCPLMVSLRHLIARAKNRNTTNP